MPGRCTGHRTSVDKGGHDEVAIFNRAFWQSTTDVYVVQGEPQRIALKIAKLPELFALSATRTTAKAFGLTMAAGVQGTMSAFDPKRTSPVQNFCSAN